MRHRPTFPLLVSAVAVLLLTPFGSFTTDASLVATEAAFHSSTPSWRKGSKTHVARAPSDPVRSEPIPKASTRQEQAPLRSNRSFGSRNNENRSNVGTWALAATLNHHNDEPYPQPVVWEVSGRNGINDDNCVGGNVDVDNIESISCPHQDKSRHVNNPAFENVQPPSSSSSLLNWQRVKSDSILAATTFRWCTRFVLPLNLCPWAAGSIQATNAIQIYTVDTEYDMVRSVESAAIRLLHDVATTGVADERTAIAFVVCRQDWDFEDFLVWFEELEEAFWDDERFADTITLAPFHPDWKFAQESDDEHDGNGNEQEQDVTKNDTSSPESVLPYEKKSPYPTVTIVCTSVIDAAGEDVTVQIANHNEERLLAEGERALRKRYQEDVIGDQ